MKRLPLRLEKSSADSVEGNRHARLLRPRCRPVARCAEQPTKGRSETWTEGEAVRMFKGAARRCSSITASRRSSPSHGRPNSRRATCRR